MTTESPAPAHSSRRALVVPGVLAALFLGLAATSVVLWFGQRHEIDPGVVVSARQEAINFFSLDYRHADQDVDRVLHQATRSFKDQYSAQRQTLLQELTTKKLILTATVPTDGAAIEYLHDDTARVLVAVDVTTAAGAAPAEPGRYRMRVELRRVHGSWLTSNLDQVG